MRRRERDGESSAWAAGIARASDPTHATDLTPESPRQLTAGEDLKRRGRERLRARAREFDLAGRRKLTGQQRLLILDSWVRSKLAAHEFASLCGVSAATLYAWKRRFEAEGPAGLIAASRRERSSRLSEATRRAILLLKEAHPDWGEDRIHDVLLRSEGFSASARAIGGVLERAGYQTRESPTRPHPPKVHRFERERANELWQTDLFTFTLRRENRRVHLVAFLDDWSRFVVAFGLHASSSGALVREVFEAGIANFGAPLEVLTDNGTQYHTWRGKSEFTRLCERRGIRQIVAAPRHPQTLGKIEPFWGTLWRELLESAIFRGIDDARARIAHFIDHYNFQRTHQGIGGAVPADRYFEAAAEVKKTLLARVNANALELAQQGEPRKPFYLTGRVGDATISLHAEGERVVLTREGGLREEVDLSASGRRRGEEEDAPAVALTPHGAPPDHPAVQAAEELAPPGSSPLDRVVERLGEVLDRDPMEQEERDASNDAGGLW